MLSLHQINSLTDIRDADCFFVDVYGVLYDGRAYYPRALDICRQLMENGQAIYVLSNATTVSSHFIEKHARLGFIKGVHYTDIITSGDVFQQKLENGFLNEVVGPNGKWTLIGRPNERLMASVMNRFTPDMDKAAVVYFGALQENGRTFASIDPYLPHTQEALKHHLPVICANPDYYAFDGDFKHVVQGSLAKWYEEQGGTVYWFGKPYPDIYRYALKKAGTAATRTVMVGDTIRTDILGGMQAGLRTVLVTGTGITADALATEPLERLIDQQGATPDYLIDKMQ